MFSKIRSAMLALAAIATLGVGAVVASTDSADARPGFHGGRGGGGHIGRHIGGGPRFGTPRIGIGRHHLVPRFRIGHHRPHFHRPHFHRPHWCWRHPWRCRVHVRWPRPIYVGAPVVAATTYAVAPVAAAAPRPCTCLTKEYTPDNLVVFKDVCTKEVASAPIGNTQVHLPMQQPQDQGQPQPQTR